MIVKRKGKWLLISSEGKILGKHDKKADAHVQEYVIQQAKKRRKK